MSNLGELTKKYEKLPLMENLDRLGQEARERYEQTGRIPDRLLTSVKDLPPTDFTDILQRVRGQQGLNASATPFTPRGPPPPRIALSEPPRTAEGLAKAQLVFSNTMKRKKEDDNDIADLLRKTYGYSKSPPTASAADLIRGTISALETALIHRGREDLVEVARQGRK